MRGDDAAGLETVRLWQAQYPLSAARVEVEFSELPGLALLDSLVGIDTAVLVDAVRSSASTGTVIRLGPHELASFTPESAFSHGWGVAETLHLGYSLYAWLAKCKITLFGIVGSDFELGSGLSPQVNAGMQKAVELIEKEIQRLIN